MSAEAVVSPVAAPRRLVVLAPNWLGDAVMALPLLSDLERAWPDTHIAVAARRGVAPLFSMAPSVDEVVTLESRSGRDAWRAWPADARLLRDGQFDAALLLPNSFVAALIASLLPSPPGAEAIASGASIVVVALCAGAVFISFERSHAFVIASALLGGGLAGFAMHGMAASPAFYAAAAPLLLAASVLLAKVTWHRQSSSSFTTRPPCRISP